MKILVTGGSGYIGSHTIVALLEAGFAVGSVDDFRNSEPFIYDRIKQITGKQFEHEALDITQEGALTEFVIKTGPYTGVIHFAAGKAVGESVNQPLLYYHNNIGGLLRVLETMQTQAIQQLVFSSSCTVYGAPDKLPVTESSAIQPAQSPYGNTKQVGEEIIRDVVNSGTGLKAVNLRYFNPIGAHSSALIGELPRGIPNNLVPYITQTAAGLRNVLSVYGNDYATPDGTAIRDYIYVGDLAEAHVKALAGLVAHQWDENPAVFNIGTGTGVSVLEAIRAFEEANEVKVPFKYEAKRQGDVAKVWADASKAKNVLGWQAATSLQESMKTAWKWQQAILKS